MTGKNLSEIVAAVGRPSSYSAMPEGKTLVQWQATGCHMAIVFDATGQFAGITHQYAQYAPARDYRGWLWFFGIAAATIFVAFVVDSSWRQTRSPNQLVPIEMQEFAKHCEDAFSGTVQCRIADVSRGLLTITGHSLTQDTAQTFLARQHSAAKKAGFETIRFWNGRRLPDVVFLEDFKVNKPK
jgi:hypothetical protein